MLLRLCSATFVAALSYFLLPVSDALARPYCECDVKCEYDAGGLCLVGGGSTMATAYWKGTFNYKVDEGDPYGGTLKVGADFIADCGSSTGYAQTRLYSHFNAVCRGKVDWLSYLNAAGFAHKVTISRCSYKAAR